MTDEKKIEILWRQAFREFNEDIEKYDRQMRLSYPSQFERSRTVYLRELADNIEQSGGELIRLSRLFVKTYKG